MYEKDNSLAEKLRYAMRNEDYTTGINEGSLIINPENQEKVFENNFSSYASRHHSSIRSKSPFNQDDVIGYDAPDEEQRRTKRGSM